MRNKSKTGGDVSADKALIAKRLSAIRSAKPVICPAPAKPRKPHAPREPRESIFRMAKAYIDKDVYVRCAVYDLSARGARINIKDDCELPSVVVLKFDYNGVEKKAWVAWQEDDEAGLEFVTERPGPASIWP